MKAFRFFLPYGLFLVIILSGCNLPQTKGKVPTFIPEDYLPTAVGLTAEAYSESELRTLQQTTIPLTQAVSPPTATDNPPTSTPTVEAQPTQSSATPTLSIVLDDPDPIRLIDPLPDGEIQMIRPGPLSRVTSPFNVHAYLNPGEDRRVQVSLYGEDEQLLVRHLVSFQDSESEKVHLKMDLIFEISDEAETARLEISTRDTYGRISAIASTDVVLLAEGESSIKSFPDLHENIILLQPIASNLIQGDAMVVKGFTRNAPQNLIVVQLINQQGGLVGTKVIEVEEENLGGGYRYFADEVPFVVESASWIRVQFFARDGKFSGLQHLSSVEVLVSP